MAGKLLHWTRNFRATMRRRAGERPSETALEREIVSGVLGVFHSVPYRCADRPDGHYLFVGEMIEALTGYPAADYRAGRVSIKNLLGPRDLAVREREIDLAVKDRRRFDLSYRIRRADGEDRWVHELGRGVYQDGELLAVDGLLTDVTESKRPLGEELFALLVQHINDYAIFMLDDAGRVATWNPGAKRILGFDAEEILGRSFAAFYPKPGEDEKLVLHRAAELGSETKNGWLRRKGGLPFWATAVITPVYEAKRLARFAMIVRDFGGGTGENAATRLHQLADEVPAFVWVADPSGRTSYVNTRWTEYTGQSLADALGDGWTRALHPEDAERAKAFRRGDAEMKSTIREAEYRIKGADGNYRWFLSRGSPIRDSDGRVVAYFGTTVDIDEKISLWRSQEARVESLEHAVRERTKDLQESVAELESFSYTASHDLRAPLRSIAGHAQMVLRDFGEKLPAGGHDHILRLSAAAEKLDRLIHDLVVYSSLSRTKLSGKEEALDLDRFISELTVRLLPEAEVSIRPSLGRVQGHRSLLSHAITNVLDNARKFTREGEKPKVTIWSESTNGRLRLYVEDQGIGIDRSLLDKAFKPFQRVHGKDYPGSGIGLAIVKRSVELLGGSVRIESELGRGSRVCLELPAAA
jgi:PAS domain S-box-containing protein